MQILLHHRHTRRHLQEKHTSRHSVLHQTVSSIDEIQLLPTGPVCLSCCCCMCSARDGFLLKVDALEQQHTRASGSTFRLQEHATYSFHSPHGKHGMATELKHTEDQVEADLEVEAVVEDLAEVVDLRLLAKIPRRISLLHNGLPVQLPSHGCKLAVHLLIQNKSPVTCCLGCF